MEVIDKGDLIDKEKNIYPTGKIYTYSFHCPLDIFKKKSDQELGSEAISIDTVKHDIK